MAEKMRARVLQVRTDKHGAELSVAAAIGDTTLKVKDAGDFAADETELGVLLVDDDSQATVSFTSVDFVEDTDPSDLTTPDTIHLATGLTAAIAAGTQLWVWDGDEVVADYIAVCRPESEDDRAVTGNAIRATIPPHLKDDLPSGRQPKPGIRVVLEWDDEEDEWTVARFRGSARGIRFEADDVYLLTAADITAGTATIPLTHRPVDESVKLWWRTVAQQPTEYTVNASQQTITLPLGSFAAAGDPVWVHYAYLAGQVKETSPVPFTRVGSAMGHGHNWDTVDWPPGAQDGDYFIFAQLTRVAATNTCTDSRAHLLPGAPFDFNADRANVWTGRVSNVGTPLVASATDLGGVQEDVYGLLVIRPERPFAVDPERIGNSGSQGTGPIPGLPGRGSGAVGIGFSVAGIGGAAAHSWVSPWTFNVLDSNGAYARISFVLQDNPVIPSTPAISTDAWLGLVLGLTEG